jgi:hypothetical protein
MTNERFAQIERMIKNIEEHGYGEINLKMRDGEWYLFEQTIKERPINTEEKPTPLTLIVEYAKIESA